MGVLAGWLAALGIVVLTSLDRDGETTAQDPGAEVTNAPTTTFEVSVPTVARASTAPPAPGGQADGFDRAGDQGLAGGPEPFGWQVVAGSWTTDGTAAVPAPQGGDALVVATLEVAQGTIGATLGHAAYGGALVFRYAGPEDYWLLRVAPGFGMQVVQVVGGAETVIDYVSADVEDGLRFGVTLEDGVVEVWTNERLSPVAYDVPAAPGADRFGLLASPPLSGDTAATFDKIEVLL